MEANVKDDSTAAHRMPRTYLRIALFAGLLVIPLVAMAAIMLADATGDVWVALRPLGIPYLCGLVPGVVLVAYLVMTGNASARTGQGTNVRVGAAVAAVAVPAAIILPTTLGYDFRTVVIMLVSGLLAPFIPLVIVQLLREDAVG